MAAAPSEIPASTLPPVDQCSDEKDFDSFRYALSSAVARRDREGLLALVAPDVLINFGGSTGHEELLKEWEFDAAEHGNIWDQLDMILKLGCARSGEAHVIPSLITQLDPFEDDEVERVLILPGAKLYESAGVEAPDPTTTPWSLAPVVSRVADWGIGVRLPDGREGYIPDDEHYEPAGHRLVIEKQNGNWLITALVAGD